MLQLKQNMYTGIPVLTREDILYFLRHYIILAYRKISELMSELIARHQ